MLSSLSETHNVNVGIASAITALARIHMSKFKNNSNFNLYYTDTDSIFIDLSPEQLMELYPTGQYSIGSELGQLN
jgi:hypothetical protein